MVHDTLEGAGFRVLSLESAFGFIKLVREQDPSLILLDVGLESMNGTKLVTLGRQHAAPHTRIVLYSGRNEAALQQDVQASNADGFIHKSTTGQALVRAVRALISKESADANEL